MVRLFNISLILMILLIPFCKQESSSNLSTLDKDKLQNIIHNLSIISKLDTSKIELLTDSIKVLLSGIEEYEDYLTNISSDSFINLEELLEIYTKVNAKMRSEKRPANRIILPKNPKK